MTIKDSLSLLYKDGDTIMIGVLSQSGRMEHKFFTSIDSAAAYAAHRDKDAEQVAGIYVPVQKLKRDAKSNSKDDVLAYTHFLIDVDRKVKKTQVLDDNRQPVLDSKGKPKMRYSNATEQERAECLVVANKVSAWVSSIVGAKPTICDSGNGYHLLWTLSCPCKASAETERTVKECVLAVKQRFDTETVDIDASVSDPGQLVRLWGTWNRKAPSEPGCPQRQSGILYHGKGVVIFPSSLDLLSCECKAVNTPKTSGVSSSERLVSVADPEWLEDYGVADWCDWAGEYAELLGDYEKGDETHFMLGNCVFDTGDGLHQHQDGKNQRQTELILYPDGGVKFTCLGSDDWFHDNEELFGFKGKEGKQVVPSTPTFRMLVNRVNQLKGENYPHRIFPAKEVSLEELEEFGVRIDCESEADEDQPSEGLVQHADEAHEPEPKLKYPHLLFPVSAIEKGSILEKLTTKACEGGLSEGLVVPSILTLVSAVPLLDTMEGARINQFCTLLSMVGAGKDTSIDRALKVTGIEQDFDLYSTYTPSGERSVAQLIGDTAPPKGETERIPGPQTYCIITYELDETVKKARGETSGVFQALQWFYDHNRKDFSDTKSRTKLNVDCRLSWLTALPVGDVEIDETEYSRAFGESSLHGIASRMIFGFSEVRFDRRRTRNWDVPESFHTWSEGGMSDIGIGEVDFSRQTSYVDKWRNHVVRGFETPDLENEYINWNPEQDLSGRDTYHILKMAILCAIVNLHEHITQADWEFAKAFMEWQAQIRLAFRPSRAKRMTQGEFHERVIREVIKRTRKLKESGKEAKNSRIVTIGDKTFYFVRWKAMSNDNKWHLVGLDVAKVVHSLVNSGALMYRPVPKEEQGDDGKSEDQNWVMVAESLLKQKGW